MCAARTDESRIEVPDHVRDQVLHHEGTQYNNNICLFSRRLRVEKRYRAIAVLNSAYML
jgi:hypothetical protein